ncbi:MAG: Ig-like domain-containing protein, partial [Cellvibrionaceae bacterium]|nr:Ig-like domain-containing protein [Cellvibrionaceae bacterium]
MAITLNVCAKDESGTRVSLDNNSVCESTCFQLSGTAEPGKTVKLYDNGEYIGLSQADADGNWQYEAKGLKCGSHEFVAQTYTAGVGPGQSSESFSVVISPSENDPAEVQVQLPDGTTIFDGGVRDTAQPRISGYGQPGATVKISADGETYGPVEIDGDGQWAVDITKPLPQGEVVLAAQAESASGQRAYFGLKLDINTTVLEAEAASARSVDAPTIDSVEDNVGTRQGQLLDNAHTDDDIPLLRGSADAFAQVEVYDNGTLIGDVFADASGNWRWSPSTALPEGSHRFSAVAIDLDGNRSDESQSFTIILDRTAEQVTDFRAVDDVGAVTGIIGQGQITDDPRPSIRGGGVPGASVEIFDNGVSIGTVTVDANGEWELSTDMADGEHRLVAYHTDQAANTGPASEELRFTVLTSQPEPVESVAILDGGDEHLSTAELSQNVGVQIKLKDNIDVGDIVEVDVNGDGVADGSHVVGQADIGGFIQVDIAGSEYAIGDDKSVTATAVVVDGNGLRSDGVSDSSTTGLFGVAAISGYTQNNALYYQHINYYRSGDYHLIISERFDAGAVVLNVSQLVNNGSEQLVLRLGGLSDDWRIQDSSGKVAQVVNGVADISGFNLNAALNLYTDNNTYYTTTPVAPGDHTSTYQSWYGNQRDFTLTLEAQTR